MASNQDQKLKDHMVEDYGSSLEEAFTKGMHDRTKHYRAILKMFKEYHDTVVAKNNEEFKVYRISGQLQLFDDLFNDGVMTDLKEKIESELEVAETRVSDVKVPNLNWEKLGEPGMWH